MADSCEVYGKRSVASVTTGIGSMEGEEERQGCREISQYCLSAIGRFVCFGSARKERHNVGSRVESTRANQRPLGSKKKKKPGRYYREMESVRATQTLCLE